MSDPGAADAAAPDPSMFRNPQAPTFLIGLGSVSALALRHVCDRVGGRNAVHALPLEMLHLDTSPLPRDLLDALPPGCAVQLFQGNLTEVATTRANRPQLDGLWTGGYRPRSFGQGAGGIPLHGLLRARLTGGLKDVLQRRLQALLDKAGRAGAASGQASEQRVQIHIIGSLAGGTFSGAEHYLASLLEAVVRGRGLSSYTIDETVFLPDLFHVSDKDWFYAVSWAYLLRTQLLLESPALDGAVDPTGNEVAYPAGLSPFFLIGPSSMGSQLDVAQAARVVGDYLLARASGVGSRLQQREDNLRPPINKVFATPQFGLLVADRAHIAAAMAEMQTPNVLQHIVHAQQMRADAEDAVVQAFLQRDIPIASGQNRGQLLADALRDGLLQGGGPNAPEPPAGAGVADVTHYQAMIEQSLETCLDALRQKEPAWRGRVVQAVRRIEGGSGRFPCDDTALAVLVEVLGQGAAFAQRQMEGQNRLPPQREGARKRWEQALRGRSLPERYKAQQMLLHAIVGDAQTRLRADAYRYVHLLLRDALQQAGAARGQVRTRAEALRKRLQETDEQATVAAVLARLAKDRTGEALIRLAPTPDQILAAAFAAMPDGQRLPRPGGGTLTKNASDLIERVRSELDGCPVEPGGEAVLSRVQAALIQHVNLPYAQRRKLVDWLLERSQAEWLDEMRTLFSQQVHPLLALNMAAAGTETELREIVIVGYAEPDDAGRGEMLRREIENMHTQGTAAQIEVYPELRDPEVLIVLGGTYLIDREQIPNAAEMKRAYARYRERFSQAQGSERAAMEPAPDASGQLFEAAGRLFEEGAAHGR